MHSTFAAIVVRKSENRFIQSIEERKISDLPDNDVLIKVCYSSLNYKDCMSYKGNLGVTRKFPHTPGIDVAGIVVSSKTNTFKEGDQVFVVSQALGMSMPGGFGGYVSCPSEWLLPIPQGMTLKECMIFGTAGLTAAFSVDEILKSNPEVEMTEIVVSGATGGVGLLSIAILAKLGFKVSALTGKDYANELLLVAGADKILDRSGVNDLSDRGLLSPQWNFAIDTVGGSVLSTFLRSGRQESTVIATGLVSSQILNTSLLPFILRGVRLIGINSEGKNINERREIWSRLASEWKPNNLEALSNEVSLRNLGISIDKMLSGVHLGRTVVNLNLI